MAAIFDAARWTAATTHCPQESRRDQVPRVDFLLASSFSILVLPFPSLPFYFLGDGRSNLRRGSRSFLSSHFLLPLPSLLSPVFPLFDFTSTGCGAGIQEEKETEKERERENVSKRRGKFRDGKRDLIIRPGGTF